MDIIPYTFIDALLKNLKSTAVKKPINELWTSLRLHAFLPNGHSVTALGPSWGYVLWASPSNLSSRGSPFSPPRGDWVEDGAGRMEILMTVSKFASFCTMVSTWHVHMYQFCALKDNAPQSSLSGNGQID